MCIDNIASVAIEWWLVRPPNDEQRHPCECCYMSLSVYRALLRLYPASIRAEYGAELLRTFEESTRGQGRVSTILAAIGDVVPNAMLAHGAILRQDLGYAARTMSRSRGFVATVV